MNRLFYYKDICTYHIFPFLGPKLFQLHELRSVSRHWSSLIISPNRLYIRVSPDSYPNLSNAYDIICNLIDSKDDIDIPEIWLEEGTHLNTIPVINYPIIIRGIGRKESIIDGGIRYSINCNEKNMGSNYCGLYDLSITNNCKTNSRLLPWNTEQNGISFIRNGLNRGRDLKKRPKLIIKTCDIYGCKDNGLTMFGGKLSAKNLNVYQNKTGLHMWDNIEIKIQNIRLFNNVEGLLIGSIKDNVKNTIKNIICHDNIKTGLSVGGWNDIEPRPEIQISGQDTRIYNNFIGVQTDYNGIVKFINLGKKVLSGNKKINIATTMNSRVIFA